MTATAEQVPVRLDFDAHAPAFAKALAHLDNAATKQLDQVNFDHRLRDLVRVRASQLNGCAYCIDMHTKDARAAGETEQRLYALSAWEETPFFTARERAALALTEAVTSLAGARGVPASIVEAAAAEFAPEELTRLLYAIVEINAWNRIAVTTGAPEPGSYVRDDRGATRRHPRPA